MNTNESGTEGAFSRNYTMYGLLVVVFFCGLWILDMWAILFLLILLLFLYMGLIERYLFNTMTKFYQEYGNNIPRLNFFLYSMLSLGLSYVSYMVFIGAFPIRSFNINGLDFFTTYAKSLLLTLIFGYLLLFWRLFIISTRISNLLIYKLGLYGMIYRFIIIIRSIYVTNYWIRYFSENQNASFFSVLQSSSTTIASLYLMMKSFFLIILIWDFSSIRNNFITQYRKFFSEYKTIQCEKCQHDVSIPLPCGHSLCKSCMRKYIRSSPFCPVCNHNMNQAPLHAMSGGFSSYTSVFCCF